MSELQIFKILHSIWQFLLKVFRGLRFRLCCFYVPQTNIKHPPNNWDNLVDVWLTFNMTQFNSKFTNMSFIQAIVYLKWKLIHLRKLKSRYYTTLRTVAKWHHFFLIYSLEKSFHENDRNRMKMSMIEMIKWCKITNVSY